MAIRSGREECRYALMGPGHRYAMTNGTTEMLKLCAGNLDLMDVSLNLLKFSSNDLFHHSISFISSSALSWFFSLSIIVSSARC